MLSFQRNVRRYGELMPADALRWFSVRCVFQWTSYEEKPYEERLTLWRATNVEEAIAFAEKEAAAYAGSGYEMSYLGFAQAYILDEEEGRPGHGVEVFSLLRSSELPPNEYLDRFFDTGEEHLRTTGG
jgi:hypothetical protein